MGKRSRESRSNQQATPADLLSLISVSQEKHRVVLHILLVSSLVYSLVAYCGIGIKPKRELAHRRAYAQNACELAGSENSGSQGALVYDRFAPVPQRAARSSDPGGVTRRMRPPISKRPRKLNHRLVFLMSFTGLNEDPKSPPIGDKALHFPLHP